MRVRTPILQCLRTLQEVECVPRHDKNHITASRRRAVHDHIRSVITYQSTSSATRCSAANEPNDSRAQGRETGRARTDMPWPCCPHVSSAAERAELPVLHLHSPKSCSFPPRASPQALPRARKLDKFRAPLRRMHSNLPRTQRHTRPHPRSRRRCCCIGMREQTRLTSLLHGGLALPRPACSKSCAR